MFGLLTQGQLHAARPALLAEAAYINYLQSLADFVSLLPFYN